MNDFIVYCDELSKLGLCYENVGENTIKLSVWAKPGSKKTRLEVGSEGELLLFITERPIDGKANKAFQKFLTKLLGTSMVELVSGQKSKHKKFSVCFEFTKSKNLSYYLSKLDKNFNKELV